VESVDNELHLKHLMSPYFLSNKVDFVIDVCEGFFNNYIIVSAGFLQPLLLPLPLATLVRQYCIEFTITEKFRLSINVCLYGKNQPFFRVFDPRF
jgi:hypothetical protein